MNKFVALLSIVFAAQQVSGQAIEWAQCGGIGWTGAVSTSGLVCKYVHDYFSQCLRVAASQSPSPTSAPPQPTGSAGSGLNGKFVAKGKKFWGSAADSNTLNIASNANILKAEIGALTPENSMKWDSTESSRGSFNYGGSDALVNWATSNGKLVRGHTFVWHSQLPSWVSSIGDRTTLTTVIQNHINGLAGRYKGKIYGTLLLSINEMFNEDGAIRSSVFSNVFGGDSFVNVAFQAARAADPNAILYINDYNLDSNNAKLQGLVRLVNKVNGGGTRLIDGVGTQMHLQQGGTGGVAAAINALAATGLDVAVTELDIVGAQSNDYTAVVRACLNQPRCVSITSWGISDTNSWRASSSPLLWDTSYRPKAAYNAVISALA
ncbi:hypothetical protein BDN72DRAFT_870738 [Pluteus cervinus]|uniref:Uncharacterized protein n=2 Tax=Pluteus cervinus TaxID=181527 RepID=A0ACD3ATW1_9AGAR|nr:hypothetical protein BDN72DRAFT_870738 [Pluteus cervinus]